MFFAFCYTCTHIYLLLLHTVVTLRMTLTLCVDRLRLATVRASGPIHKEHNYVLRPVCVRTCVTSCSCTTPFSRVTDSQWIADTELSLTQQEGTPKLEKQRSDWFQKKTKNTCSECSQTDHSSHAQMHISHRHSTITRSTSSRSMGSCYYITNKHSPTHYKHS